MRIVSESDGTRGIQPRKRREFQALSLYGDKVMVRARAAEKAESAREVATDAIAAVKPKLRGVSHECAFFVSLVLGAALIVAAETPKATLAVAIYAVSLSALLGTSALYHRVDWARPDVRRWMRRLDHSMIFFLIAGTYTPFALLVLDGPLADAVLAVVWVGAIAARSSRRSGSTPEMGRGADLHLARLGRGAAFPASGTQMGVAGTLLVAAGGLLYTIGPSSTRPSGPTPTPGSSATTRSSTCS